MTRVVYYACGGYFFSLTTYTDDVEECSRAVGHAAGLIAMRAADGEPCAGAWLEYNRTLVVVRRLFRRKTVDHGAA